MAKRRLIFLVGLLALFAVLGSLLACIGYRTYTLKENTFQFSFEYGGQYSFYDEDVSSDRPSKHYAAFLRLGEEADETASHLLIRTITTDKEFPNAAAYANSIVLSHELAPRLGRIAKRNLTIADARAIELVYTEKGIGLSRIFRQVWFDHGGAVWYIELASPEFREKADKAFFEHLLKTFKIYD